MKKKILVFIAVIVLTLFAFIPPKTATVRADEEISSTYFEVYFTFPYYVNKYYNSTFSGRALSPYPFKLILQDTGFSIFIMNNPVPDYTYNFDTAFSYTQSPNTSYFPSLHPGVVPTVSFLLDSTYSDNFDNSYSHWLNYTVEYSSGWMQRYFPNFSYVDSISYYYDVNPLSPNFGNIYFDFIFPPEEDGSLNFSRFSLLFDSIDSHGYTSTLNVLPGPLNIIVKTGFSYLRAADVAFNKGFSEGRNDGYSTGKSEGETIGYNRGYAKGFDDGTEIGEISFYSLISSLIDVPVNAFTNLFNFNILGINLLEFMTGLLTLALCLTIFRIIFR